MTTDVHELTRELNTKNEKKIVMLVADGLGGLPIEPGRTGQRGPCPITICISETP